MNRRSFLSAVVVVPLAAVLAACGDPDRVPAEADPTPTTPPTTLGSTGDTTTGTVVPIGIDHPTGADDVVLKMWYEGGLVPVGFTFLDPPRALVSGDGRVFAPGAVPAIFPGPLLPSVLVRSAGEAEIQALLAVVQDAGLLAPPPDYTGGGNIADATNTVLMIDAAGGMFTHSAYALGNDSPESPARQNLLDATMKLSEMIDSAGSSAEPFVPTEYRLQARAIDPTEFAGDDPTPTVVDWPSTTGISLATATECARVDASAVGSLFLDAKQNTFFKEGDIVYHVFVSGVLPGDPAC